MWSKDQEGNGREIRRGIKINGKMGNAIDQTGQTWASCDREYKGTYSKYLTKCYYVLNSLLLFERWVSVFTYICNGKIQWNHTIGLLFLFLCVVRRIWSRDNLYLVILLSRTSLWVALFKFWHHILSQQKETQQASSTSLQAWLGMEKRNEGNFSFGFFLI